MVSLLSLVLALGAGTAFAKCEMMGGDKAEGGHGGMMGGMMGGMQHGGMGGGMMAGPMGGAGHWMMLDADTPEEQKFLDETADLRKKLAQDEAEYAAIMHGQNPDAKRIRELSGSIYDGKGAILAKAKALKVNIHDMMGMGPRHKADDKGGHGAGHGAGAGH